MQTLVHLPSRTNLLLSGVRGAGHWAPGGVWGPIRAGGGVSNRRDDGRVPCAVWRVSVWRGQGQGEGTQSPVPAPGPRSPAVCAQLSSAPVAPGPAARSLQPPWGLVWGLGCPRGKANPNPNPKLGTLSCIMNRESLELTAPQHTAVNRKDLTS
jgi:hypothetical protein